MLKLVPNAKENFDSGWINFAGGIKSEQGIKGFTHILRAPHQYIMFVTFVILHIIIAYFVHNM